MADELPSLHLRVAELEKLNARLSEKEALHRAFVETSQDWVWEIDTQGVILYSNPAVKQILGYRQQELRGKLIFELVHQEDRSQTEQMLRRHVTKQAGWHSLLIRWRHKEGGWRYLESNSVPVTDGLGVLTGFRGVDRDITERIQVEERLSASERFNRNIIESSNDCIKLLDLEGRLRYMSEAGQRQLHIDDVEPFLGLPLAELWDGNDRDESLRAIKAARTGGRGRFTGYAATVDGEPRWWDVAISPVVGADGEVESLLAVSRDITEQLQANEALRTLVEAMVGITGQAYFDKVTTELCRWFSADGANIGVLEDGAHIRSISMELDGEKVTDYFYPLDVTPCAKVVNKSAYVFPQDVSRLFPEDKDLAELGVIQSESKRLLMFTAIPTRELPLTLQPI